MLVVLVCLPRYGTYQVFIIIIIINNTYLCMKNTSSRNIKLLDAMRTRPLLSLARFSCPRACFSSTIPKSVLGSPWPPPPMASGCPRCRPCRPPSRSRNAVDGHCGPSRRMKSGHTNLNQWAHKWAHKPPPKRRYLMSHRFPSLHHRSRHQDTLQPVTVG